MTAPAHPVSRVLDALLALTRDAYAGHSHVRVDEGVPVSDAEAEDAVAIAASVEEVAPVASTTEFLLSAQVTAYDIRCALQSWSGDTDITARRLHAFEVLAVLLDALRADQHIGLEGLVWDTRVTETSYRPVIPDPDEQESTEGCLALVEFVIHVETYQREERRR